MKETFEEQFPSLKYRATETNSQDFGEGWGYTEETIQAHCLDKQKVREVIDKYWVKELNSWIGSCDEIKKELGLF